ncbi:hypothetical protein IB238_23140 [Rhizobium sp. ARZ01]|uniref:hypothetical protein n=1 Tax=Rhizobium sp. ARZ01 TaxID=2769313 RepID=UPI001783F3E0|nr:hypothetical protein [Rhizobium sp. ARZ01]MBD9375515.1 hypothetical protein [Rhizobium sp. ARZ01]
METATIESRADFAQWAIERASAIIAEQGGNLALAAREGSDEAIAAAANALGQTIVDTLLEVFDGLLGTE